MTTNGRIVFLRQRLGLSQRVFGEQIGRSVAYMSKVESGRVQPSEEVIRRISDAFGVDEGWLRTGAGKLEVESVGDRIKLARKAKGYTQEELAGELDCSRNTIGMIERGTVRPGDELTDSLCDCLWIDKNWLLTGVGSMERMDLTPFYELLMRDPAVRKYIRSFIDHLERPYRNTPEEEEKQEEDRWTTTYVVHDTEAARRFFACYNIPYQEEQTEDGIRFRVKAPRTIDHERAQEVQNRIRKARIPNGLCDHEFIFRDADDNTLITYSPYDMTEVRQTWIEKSPHSFYGFGTTTFVLRA